MASFPIGNILRQKRMFNPYNERHNALEDVDTSTPRADSLSEHLGAIPNREDYQLGTKDKILNAIVGGLTGFTSGAPKALNVVQENKDRPYNQALQKWGLETSGMEKAAEIESRGNNSRVHQAQVQNQFLQNLDELELHRDKQAQDEENDRARRNEEARFHDMTDQNADLNREETKRYHDETVKNQGRTASASEKRAEASMINAKRPRTGNQGKPQAYYKNEAEAKNAAFEHILEDTPDFKQYFQEDEDGSKRLLKDKAGNPQKLVGGKLYPLTPIDIQAIKNFNIQVRGKTDSYMRKVRDYGSDSSNDIPDLEDNDE